MTPQFDLVGVIVADQAPEWYAGELLAMISTD
jgi:hypothetical protein